MTRATVEFAKTVHLHNGPETSIDDAITYRGELAALRAQLDAANERNRILAADLARVTLENAAIDAALRKANHTGDELRYQLRLTNRRDATPLTLTDRGAGDGYCEYDEMDRR